MTTPAAGGKYETLRAADDAFTTDLIAAMEYDEWRDVRPDFIKRLREEVKTQRQDEALREAQTRELSLQETAGQQHKRITELEEAGRAKDGELADLREQLSRRDRDGYADRLMADSRLPSAWQSNRRVQLLGEANSGNWPGMVAGWQAEYSAVRPPIAVRGAGAAGMVMQESMNPWPEANESPEQYAARKRRIIQRS